jgi:hypothetical protein
VWKAFEAARPLLPLAEGNRGIGTPDELREHLRGFAETGVDQVAFIQQGGRNRHEDICASLELFAKDVLPEYKEKEEERQRKKMEELAPYLEKAMARKERLKALRDEEIPDVPALGRQIIETAQNITPEQVEQAKRMSQIGHVPLEDPAKAARE